MVNGVLVELSKQLHIRCWKNHTGLFRDFNDAERVIKIGTKGRPDIEGFINPRSEPLYVSLYAIHFGIEVKTGNGVQATEQKAYEALCKRMRVPYYVARTVPGALEFCKQVANGSWPCGE